MKSGGRNSGPLIVKLFFRRCKVRKVCVEDGCKVSFIDKQVFNTLCPDPGRTEKNNLNF